MYPTHQYNPFLLHSMPPTGKKTTFKSTPAVTDSGDGDHEVFDLNVSDPEPDVPQVQVPNMTKHKLRPTDSLRSIDSTDSQAPKSAALDIAYFFSSKTGKPSRHCVVCKWVQNITDHWLMIDTDDQWPNRAAFDALENRADWPPSRTYTYSTSTSNTGLRGHLDRFHKEEYIKLSKERGWTTMLPSTKRELELAVAPGPAIKKRMFTSEAVTRLLVRFIAANDQVSFGHWHLFLTNNKLIFLGSVLIRRRKWWISGVINFFSRGLWGWWHASPYQAAHFSNWNLAGMVCAVDWRVESMFLPLWKFCTTLMRRASEISWGTPVHYGYLVR